MVSSRLRIEIAHNLTKKSAYISKPVHGGLSMSLLGSLKTRFILENKFSPLWQIIL